LALAGSERDAADLTQETFLILCKHKGQVREPDKIKSWLFTTLRRTFLKTLQARHSRLEVELKPKQQALSTVDPTAPRSVDAGTILSALCGLKEDYRIVLELFCLGDLSYKEIATTLQIPVGTVMSRLARGKEQLSGALTKEKLTERSPNFGNWQLRSSR
jgi:RNA polymerase sigma-70 factor, ECF subfamily